jgi:hypothetical protein
MLSSAKVNPDSDDTVPFFCVRKVGYRLGFRGEQVGVVCLRYDTASGVRVRAQVYLNTGDGQFHKTACAHVGCKNDDFDSNGDQESDT